MRRLASAAAGLTCLIAITGLGSTHASAQELQWLGAVSEDGASLTYGIPESDAALIDFTCDRGSGTVTVTLDYEPANAETGMKAEINLAPVGGPAGSAIIVSATGERLELDDKFVLQGTTDLSDGLRSLLLEASALAVTVGDGAEELPLEDARDAAQKLVDACKR